MKNFILKKIKPIYSSITILFDDWKGKRGSKRRR
jgi:hypothetical protein